MGSVGVILGVTEIVAPLGLVAFQTVREKRRIERFQSMTFLVRAGALTRDIIDEIQQQGGTVRNPSPSQAAAMDKGEAPLMPQDHIAIFGSSWECGKRQRIIPFLPLSRWKAERRIRFQVTVGESSRPLIAENETSINALSANGLVLLIVRRL